MSSATESILTGGFHVWLGNIMDEVHKLGGYACYLWPEQGSWRAGVTQPSACLPTSRGATIWGIKALTSRLEDSFYLHNQAS